MHNYIKQDVFRSEFHIDMLDSEMRVNFAQIRIASRQLLIFLITIYKYHKSKFTISLLCIVFKHIYS